MKALVFAAILLASCAVDRSPTTGGMADGFVPRLPPCVGYREYRVYTDTCVDPRQRAEPFDGGTWCRCPTPPAPHDVRCGEITRSDPRAIGCPGYDDDAGTDDGG